MTQSLQPQPRSAFISGWSISTPRSRAGRRLAHEIKNPLSTIRLNMELLAEDFADAETPRDRRALTKIAARAAGVPAAARPARQLPQFRQGRGSSSSSRPI